MREAIELLNIVDLDDLKDLKIGINWRRRSRRRPPRQRRGSPRRSREGLFGGKRQVDDDPEGEKLLQQDYMEQSQKIVRSSNGAKHEVVLQE